MNASGILLFAHGARDPAWAQPFEAAMQKLRARSTETQVALAFLEFMAPSILEAGAALVSGGCKHVTVVPLFLGAGGHVRKDLPRLVGELAAQYPAVQWVLSPAVGETDLLIQALADSALQLAQAAQGCQTPASN